MTTAPVRHTEKLLLSTACFLALFVAWHIAVRVTGTDVFPSPWEVLLGFRELVIKGHLLAYARDSLIRVLSGYGLAVLAGIPFGILMGWYEPFASMMNPLIQMFRPISPLAWMPLAVIWFGIGNSAPIFLIFIAAFFPIVVATMNGVRNVPPMYLRAASNFGLSGSAILIRVVLPAILPRVMTGLRLALGIAWLVVVAAEMIAVDSGLGYLIIDSRNAGKRYDLVVGGMILIGLIGLALDTLVRRAERIPSLRWGFRKD
ncbi:MAG TPA: ABC transporter permease [Thermoanaerobaculia bacterium]|nr:ABC transporter permease [Thermoanaerobaculia bacterium]